MKTIHFLFMKAMPWLCVLTLAVSVLKSVTRIFHMNQMDRILMKLHMPAVMACMTCMLLHTVLTAADLSSIPVWLSGWAADFFLMAAIWSYHARKKWPEGRWLKMHQLFSASAVILTLIHLLIL